MGGGRWVWSVLVSRHKGFVVLRALVVGFSLCGFRLDEADQRRGCILDLMVTKKLAMGQGGGMKRCFGMKRCYGMERCFIMWYGTQYSQRRQGIVSNALRDTLYSEVLTMLFHFTRLKSNTSKNFKFLIFEFLVSRS